MEIGVGVDYREGEAREAVALRELMTALKSSKAIKPVRPLREWLADNAPELDLPDELLALVDRWSDYFPPERIARRNGKVNMSFVTGSLGVEMAEALADYLHRHAAELISVEARSDEFETEEGDAAVGVRIVVKDGQLSSFLFDEASGRALDELKAEAAKKEAPKHGGKGKKKVSSVSRPAVDKKTYKAVVQACWDNDEKTVAALLKRGFQVDTEGEFGSPMDAAVLSNARRVIKLLAANGADLNRRVDSRSAPPIFAALSSADFNIDTVRLLLKLGANPNVPGIGNNEYALRLAIQGCRVETVKLLLEYGADVSRLDRNGNTFLHVACAPSDVMQSRAAQLAIVGMLLEHGVNPEVRNKEQLPAIFIAAENLQLHVIELLVSKGVDINTTFLGGSRTLDVVAAFSAVHGWDDRYVTKAMQLGAKCGEPTGQYWMMARNAYEKYGVDVMHG